MRLPLPHLFRSLAVVLSLALGSSLLAQAPSADKKVAYTKPEPSKFIRIVKDKEGQPVSLDTATVRYVSASGEGELIVDLVGVVHIGDRSYYEKLNRQFEQYDVLLYELVAPQGTRIPKGGRRDSDNPIALIQQMSKSFLKLDSQTDVVDYTRKNFVHADLSPREMAEAMRKRGDDGMTLFLSIAADLLRQQNLQEQNKAKGDAPKEPEIDLLTLLLDPNGPVKMKRVFAQQLANMESPEGSLGQTMHTILVTDRNQAALKVFQKELAKGKKKIGIFYGAAHMPDFEKRLREDFGLKRHSDQWLTAWDMK